tara:strand:- start:57 stop:410 length:354 start_codon:yes stop_codon:yes gene_type:complete
MKNNIIQFPIERRKQQLSNEEIEAEEYFIGVAENSEELAQTALGIIEDLLEDLELDEFQGIDFRNLEYMEAKDAFVVVNLIASMFMRYGGISHFLQPDLEVLFDKLMEEQEQNDDIT